VFSLREDLEVPLLRKQKRRSEGCGPRKWGMGEAGDLVMGRVPRKSLAITTVF
jgi:hypothetical protein